MRISIFGLGYVGAVTAGCLAEMGHTVVGVEPNPAKLEMLNRGQSPIIEAGLEEILKKFVANGQISATSDWAAAVAQTELAFVCVGTPSLANGNIDLSHVRQAAEQIGSALRGKKDYFRVVIRSTVLPGTMDDVVIPALERASGRQAGRDFGVCMNPEFLRESTAVHDFYHPPKMVIGELDTRSGEALAELYAKLPAPLERVPLRLAEMVKYTDNSFHAVKVVFANEIGNICKELKIDSHRVMEIFCLDTKLNLSPYYLKPGFAFGGSCLPKDLRAIISEARSRNVDTPMLNSLLDSNKRQVSKVVNKLREYRGKKLGFLGLSFKGGTDDFRESPMVDLIETMLGKGFSVRICDPYVSLGRLIGANKEYIEREIPHLSSLLSASASDLIEQCDVLVIGQKLEDPKAVLAQVGQRHVVIDLARACDGHLAAAGEYYGICW
jgi:GDP-mannose 6-dehydrogenase